MARPPYIELGQGPDLIRIPILYEDRSVMAIDKPAGWLLVPFSWQRTSRNLAAALVSSIAAGDFWAKSRNLKFLRNIHRLDGDTSGILLMGRSLGAVDTLSNLFEERRISKTYLVVVEGTPSKSAWTCRVPIGPDPRRHGRVIVDFKGGRDAETDFRVVASKGNTSLVEARPLTGRTHQIRVHLLEAGHPVVGDELYGRPLKNADPWAPFPLGLRAARLAYIDPFVRRPVRIAAPVGDFLKAFGWPADAWKEEPEAKGVEFARQRPTLTKP